MIATPLMSTRCVYPDVFTVLKSSRLIILGKPAIFFKNQILVFFSHLFMDFIKFRLHITNKATVINHSAEGRPKPP